MPFKSGLGWRVAPGRPAGSGERYRDPVPFKSGLGWRVAPGRPAEPGRDSPRMRCDRTRSAPPHHCSS